MVMSRGCGVTFNSLFEMRTLLKVSQHNPAPMAFNSLFEMPTHSSCLQFPVQATFQFSI